MARQIDLFIFGELRGGVAKVCNFFLYYLLFIFMILWLVIIYFLF